MDKNTPLTEEQIKNWRMILFDKLGPYALIMPVEQVQALRDKMQKNVQEVEQKRTEEA